MGEISEQKYAAGWLIELEYLLWADLHRPKKSGGLLPFERAGLKHLVKLAGGWWAFVDGSLKFLERVEWLSRYKAYARRKTVRPRP